MPQTINRTTTGSVISRVGIVTLVIGAILLVIGGILQLTWTQPDANIGAGLFIFGGALLIVAGFVVFAVSRLVRRR